jgi:hypothetical protein
MLKGMDYRNRYRISTAAGPILLSVPIVGGRRQGATLSDVLIDYTHAWQRQHWRTLLSAYGRAPFFEHYGPPLEAIILKDYQTLLDFNLAAIRWLNKEMRLNVPIEAITTTEAAGPVATMYDQDAMKP